MDPTKLVTWAIVDKTMNEPSICGKEDKSKIKKLNNRVSLIADILECSIYHRYSLVSYYFPPYNIKFLWDTVQK